MCTGGHRTSKKPFPRQQETLKQKTSPFKKPFRHFCSLLFMCAVDYELHFILTTGRVRHIHIKKPSMMRAESCCYQGIKDMSQAFTHYYYYPDSISAPGLFALRLP